MFALRAAPAVSRRRHRRSARRRRFLDRGRRTSTASLVSVEREQYVSGSCRDVAPINTHNALGHMPHPLHGSARFRPRICERCLARCVARSDGAALACLLPPEVLCLLCAPLRRSRVDATDDRLAAAAFLVVVGASTASVVSVELEQPVSACCRDACCRDAAPMNTRNALRQMPHFLCGSARSRTRGCERCVARCAASCAALSDGAPFAVVAHSASRTSASRPLRPLRIPIFSLRTAMRLISRASTTRSTTLSRRPF